MFVMCMWRHLQEDRVGPGRPAVLDVAVGLAPLVALVAKVTTDRREELEGLGAQVSTIKYFNDNNLINNNCYYLYRTIQLFSCPLHNFVFLM